MSEQIRWSTIDLGGSIDALHAKHILRFSFEPHWHEEFTVGLLNSGVVQFHHDGKTEHITTDKVTIVNPGEVHSGDGFGSPNFDFRMVYIPESSFRELVSQGTKLPGSLCFSQTVLSDPAVSRDLSRALHSLDSDTSLLAKQGMLLDMFRFSWKWRRRSPITTGRVWPANRLDARVCLSQVASRPSTEDQRLMNSCPCHGSITNCQR